MANRIDDRGVLDGNNQAPRGKNNDKETRVHVEKLAQSPAQLLKYLQKRAVRYKYCTEATFHQKARKPSTFENPFGINDELWRNNGIVDDRAFMAIEAAKPVRVNQETSSSKAVIVDPAVAAVSAGTSHRSRDCEHNHAICACCISILEDDDTHQDGQKPTDTASVLAAPISSVQRQQQKKPATPTYNTISRPLQPGRGHLFPQPSNSGIFERSYIHHQIRAHGGETFSKPSTAATSQLPAQKPPSTSNESFKEIGGNAPPISLSGQSRLKEAAMLPSRPYGTGNSQSHRLASDNGGQLSSPGRSTKFLEVPCEDTQSHLKINLIENLGIVTSKQQLQLQEPNNDKDPNDGNTSVTVVQAVPQQTKANQKHSSSQFQQLKQANTDQVSQSRLGAEPATTSTISGFSINCNPQSRCGVCALCTQDQNNIGLLSSPECPDSPASTIRSPGTLQNCDVVQASPVKHKVRTIEIEEPAGFIPPFLRSDGLKDENGHFLGEWPSSNRCDLCNHLRQACDTAQPGCSSCIARGRNCTWEQLEYNDAVARAIHEVQDRHRSRAFERPSQTTNDPITPVRSAAAVAQSHTLNPGHTQSSIKPTPSRRSDQFQFPITGFTSPKAKPLGANPVLGLRLKTFNETSAAQSENRQSNLGKLTPTNLEPSQRVQFGHSNIRPPLRAQQAPEQFSLEERSTRVQPIHQARVDSPVRGFAPVRGFGQPTIPFTQRSSIGPEELRKNWPEVVIKLHKDQRITLYANPKDIFAKQPDPLDPQHENYCEFPAKWKPLITMEQRLVNVKQQHQAEMIPETPGAQVNIASIEEDRRVKPQGYEDAMAARKRRAKQWANISSEKKKLCRFEMQQDNVHRAMMVSHVVTKGKIGIEVDRKRKPNFEELPEAFKRHRADRYGDHGDVFMGVPMQLYHTQDGRSKETTVTGPKEMPWPPNDCPPKLPCVGTIQEMEMQTHMPATAGPKHAMGAAGNPIVFRAPADFYPDLWNPPIFADLFKRHLNPLRLKPNSNSQPH